MAGWRLALAELGSPRVGRVIVTQLDPDHIGASAAPVELTGVCGGGEGELDGAHLGGRCGRPTRWLKPYVRFFIEHGMPRELAERMAEADSGSAVHPATPTQLVSDHERIN